MSLKILIAESKFLERSRIALTNAGTHADIESALASYGMDAARLAEGLAIYTNALEVWERNKAEDAESEIASRSYKASYNQLQALFKRHRDQVLIYFRKQADILSSLGVNGRFPIKYNDFFVKVKQFYSTIQKNATLQTEMDKIKITSAVVADCLSQLDRLLADRANYDKELGESQDVTKSKNAALLTLKEWMDDFDAIAKVALYDQPQLLEVLGIFVRS